MFGKLGPSSSLYDTPFTAMRALHQVRVEHASWPCGRIWADGLTDEFTGPYEDFDADVGQYGCLDAYNFQPAGAMHNPHQIWIYRE